jgi:hypothetical protein
VQLRYVGDLLRARHAALCLIDAAVYKAPVERVGVMLELLLDIFEVEESGTVGICVEHPCWELI